MTQTHTPASPPAPAIAWCQALQLKLMAALDAAWAIIERTDDPAQIRQARDRAKAIGEIAAMGRKVAQFMPTARTAQAAKEGAAKQAPAGLSLEPLAAALAPLFRLHDRSPHPGRDRPPGAGQAQGRAARTALGRSRRSAHR
jgi:hypothetical protein